MPLPDAVRSAVVPAILERPTVSVLLAYAADEPVGFATCIEGFSSFAASPLLNLHDLMVEPEWRGHGVAQQLLEGQTQIGKEHLIGMLDRAYAAKLADESAEDPEHELVMGVEELIEHQGHPPDEDQPHDPLSCGPAQAPTGACSRSRAPRPTWSRTPGSATDVRGPAPSDSWNRVQRVRTLPFHP